MTKLKLETQQGICYRTVSSQALLFTEPRQPFGTCRNVLSTDLKKSKTESQWSSNSFLPFFTVRMFIVAICLFFRKTKLSVLVVSHKLQTERAQMPPQFIKTKDFPSEKEKWQLLRNWIAKVRMVSCVVFSPTWSFDWFAIHCWHWSFSKFLNLPIQIQTNKSNNERF